MAPRVLFIAAHIDGCGFWRIYLPTSVYPGALYMEPTPQPVQLNLDVDVAVVQRQTSEISCLGIQAMQARGIRVIHDIDDDLWTIPRWNPGYRHVKESLPWLEKCLAAADLITVSTPPLLRVMEKRGFGPVRCIENAIDLNIFQRLNPLPERDIVKIGWPSSPTHHMDGQVAVAELIALMEEFPQVRADFGGEVPDPIAHAIFQRRIDPKRISASSVPIGLYPRWLNERDWDFTVAPLAEAKFNVSKSWLKMIEAGSLHIPCLASDIAEYRRFCTPGLELLLCRSRDDWREKLRWMITDAAARKEWGERVFDRVYERHQVAQRTQDWEAAVAAAYAQPAKPVNRAVIAARLRQIIERARPNPQREEIKRLVAATK
jgi:hypothetical protein